MEKTMKKYVFIIISLSLCLNVIAAPLTKTGKCKLSGEKTVKVTLKNAKVQVLAEFKGGDFFGSSTLFAVPKVTNLAGKKMKLSYNVAFFDKKNKLLACTAQSGDIPADANGYQLGSALISLPADVIKQIASYQLVIYELAFK
jgi:hypothetical protein